DGGLPPELLGTEELRELIDPAAVTELELELQGLKPERWPRDADEAHDLLARLGDLSPQEPGGPGAQARGVLDRRRRRRTLPRRAGCVTPRRTPRCVPGAGGGAAGIAAPALGAD